jgi:hypothetical protein
MVQAPVGNGSEEWARRSVGWERLRHDHYRPCPETQRTGRTDVPIFAAAGRLAQTSVLFQAVGPHGPLRQVRPQGGSATTGRFAQPPEGTRVVTSTARCVRSSNFFSECS